ncbi:MAG: hypothetical protein EKK48_25105 [Candidatus Melainabacteria bacterium]|nr:MAG: hypothetical protein EKK48_25105 [Candidatus Melainabacteria bacterium]
MVLKTISAGNKNKTMASIALFALFLQPVGAFAQQQGMMGAGGPIDIKADEQEFGEGHVVARGRVRVTYKDSVVVAPMATLYRDAGGSPQKAVFTGHPHLTQGANRIDSDVLIFEIASQKIIADGHAHSEVLENAPLGGPMDGPAEMPEEDLSTPGFGKTTTKPAQKTTKLASKSNPGMGKSGQINWPTKQGDAANDAAAKATAKAAPAPEVAAKPGVKSPIVPHTAADDDYGDARPGDAATPTTEQLMAPPPTSSAGQAKSETKVAKKDPAAKGPPEKIITDSRYQEYNRATGRFEARGDVHVRHGDIRVVSDRLQLVYGADAKPESALFTGHVSATQNENNTQADTMTYFLATQRLQATGNVRSKVIQKKGDGPKKGGPDAGSQAAGKTARSGDTTAFTDSSAKYSDENSKLADNAKVSTFSRPGAAGGDKSKLADGTKSGSSKGFSFDPDNKEGEPMYIDSDAQDYSKDTGRMAAQGNVKVRYGDTTGVGQNVVLVRNIDGQAEKLIFTGRSQIIQPGKRWIGDKITMMVNDRKVLAQGNTRAYILQSSGQSQARMPGSLGGKREPLKLTPSIPSAVPTQAVPSPAAPAVSPASAGSLAGNKSQVSASPNSKLSASKIEATE